MKALFLITARGGSKGIPGKNIKPLAGKPLIYYSIDVARAISSDEHICVSTDDDAIIKVVEDYGLEVPFKRPYELATDTAGSYEVIRHAVEFYEEAGINYDCVVLLQPTSPLRKLEHIKESLQLFKSSLDMVVSVSRPQLNPFHNLFKENEQGYLLPSFNHKHERRQDGEKLYCYNGSIYIINTNSLKKSHISEFEKVVKYEMDKFHSVDIDEPIDWDFTEFLIKNNRNMLNL